MNRLKITETYTSINNKSLFRTKSLLDWISEPKQQDDNDLQEWLVIRYKYTTHLRIR